jgi:hypothetical protein
MAVPAIPTRPSNSVLMERTRLSRCDNAVLLTHRFGRRMNVDGTAASTASPGCWLRRRAKPKEPVMTVSTTELNGMAHVILTVSRFEVARFYRRLLPQFGMKPVFVR